MDINDRVGVLLGRAVIRAEVLTVENEALKEKIQVLEEEAHAMRLELSKKREAEAGEHVTVIADSSPRPARVE